MTLRLSPKGEKPEIHVTFGHSAEQGDNPCSHWAKQQVCSGKKEASELVELIQLHAPSSAMLLSLISTFP